MESPHLIKSSVTRHAFHGDPSVVHPSYASANYIVFCLFGYTVRWWRGGEVCFEVESLKYFVRLIDTGSLDALTPMLNVWLDMEAVVVLRHLEESSVRR